MMPETQKSIRNESIEVLRCLSMLMVLVLHYFEEKIGSGLGEWAPGNYANCYVGYFLKACSYVAVDVFILISGYFLSTQKTFKWNKVIMLVLQCWFYSYAIYFLACACGWLRFDFHVLITSCMLPLISGHWWFMYPYLVMYLISPYLNIWHNAMDKRQHEYLLAIAGVFFVIFPTCIFWSGHTLAVRCGYSLIWFVYLYMLAAYLRKYAIEWSCRIPWLGIYFASCAITCGVSVIQKGILGKCLWNLYMYNSLTNVAAAVALFMSFLNRGKLENWKTGKLENWKTGKLENWKTGKLWRFIGKGTLGVFLIHTHFALSDVLWGKWVRADLAFSCNTFIFIGHFVLWILGIFIVCVVIDLLRGFIFDLVGSKFHHKKNIS